MFWVATNEQMELYDDGPVSRKSREHIGVLDETESSLRMTRSQSRGRRTRIRYVKSRRDM